MCELLGLVIPTINFYCYQNEETLQYEFDELKEDAEILTLFFDRFHKIDRSCFRCFEQGNGTYEEQLIGEFFDGSELELIKVKRPKFKHINDFFLNKQKGRAKEFETVDPDTPIMIEFDKDFIKAQSDILKLDLP